MNGVSVDGWQCSFGTSSLNCTWGGAFAFGGSGITNNGSTGNHAGYSGGIMLITAQELIDGRIDHALAMNTQCLNNPSVYPADRSNGGTDQSCGGSGPPSYGDLIHLLWTPAQIAASAYSSECKTILTALATYGAFAKDTGNLGLSITAQSALSFTALGLPDPWTTTIVPHLRAAGDASGSTWSSCLNRLSASSFELLQIPAGDEN